VKANTVYLTVLHSRHVLYTLNIHVIISYKTY